MIHLIFAGRLTYEKGFDLILDFCDQIDSSIWKDKITLHVFGQGDLSPILIKNHYSFVEYYGWKEKSEVISVWKDSSYCLMPSRFLETFGLSALDSLSVGVPVIGFRKGGLGQFGECIIDGESDEIFPKKVIDYLGKTESKEIHQLSKKCIEVSRQYSWGAWKERFETIVSYKIKDLDLLLISDYASSVGGIESYINDVFEVMKKNNCTSVSKVYGTVGKSKLTRILALPYTLFNFGAEYRLKKFVQKNEVSLVWRHSIHRVLGWLPLSGFSNKFNGKQILMIHDFGLIHPFPSKVFNESQLLESMDFSLRMEAGFEVFGGGTLAKIISFLPLVFKFYGNKLIHKQIKKNVSIILVPSEFMKNAVQYIFPENRIEVLSHAI